MVATPAQPEPVGTARIISASRRTDLPAFHVPWFMARVAAGFCHWLNPFGGRVQRVDLRPEAVAAFVFWTRLPTPLLRVWPQLLDRGYRGCFQFTLNDYPRELEPHAPDLGTALSAFAQASETVGPSFIGWRYDPIVLTDTLTADEHRRRFATLCRHLAGQTTRCTTSFVETYGKTRRALARVATRHGIRFITPGPDERLALARDLGDIARAHGITLHACCSADLTAAGLTPAHCVDRSLIAQLRPDLRFTAANRPTRPGCGCHASIDVGAYDTCRFGCAYCYAAGPRQVADAPSADDVADSLLARPPRLRGATLP